MYIVADENMALVQAFFGHLGQLQCYAGRQLSAEQVKMADILLVRSVTPVNKQLLAGSAVRFVGSATIGFDHIDQTWLAQQGIVVRTAPACNAQSVVEYVFSALAYLSQKLAINIENKVLGIIGLGNVGSLLAHFAQILGFKVIGYDPFVTRDTIEQVDLPTLLTSADIVSLHTPLTTTGLYPTHHLLGKDNLSLLKRGAILLSSGRGAVIDNGALLTFLQQQPQHLAAVCLDVWEHEPLVNTELAQVIALATPHIAGYSLEGKWRGTEMIYQALCHFLQIPTQHQLADFLPKVTHKLVWPNLDSLWANYAALLRQTYPIEHDNQAFRQSLLLPTAERGLAFDTLRKHYWSRRESSAYDLYLTPSSWVEPMTQLGFKIIV